MSDTEPAGTYWLTVLLQENEASLCNLPVSIRQTDFSFVVARISSHVSNLSQDQNVVALKSSLTRGKHLQGQ
jgi:hypothetical protein